jgi:hypothetical protein
LKRSQDSSWQACGSTMAASSTFSAPDAMAFGDATTPDASNAPLARIFFIEIAWPAEPANPKKWEIHA